MLKKWIGVAPDVSFGIGEYLRCSLGRMTAPVEPITRSERTGENMARFATEKHRHESYARATRKLSTNSEIVSMILLFGLSFPAVWVNGVALALPFCTVAAFWFEISKNNAARLELEMNIEDAPYKQYGQEATPTKRDHTTMPYSR